MRPSWKIRRRIIYGVLLFCAASIVYLMVWGRDTAVNQTIALGLVGLAISTVGAYVFGATWDDRNAMSLIGKDAYRDLPALDYPSDVAAPEGYAG
jgi:hypothetical protein